MDWKCSIEKMENGFALYKPAEEGGEPTCRLYEFFEELDEDKAEKEAFRRMAYDLIEYFGIFNGNHEKSQLKIEVETEVEKE
jgi:hypothetical protein